RQLVSAASEGAVTDASVCLEARSGQFQEFDLFGRAGAPERRVAVRKAPETLDDVAVSQSVASGVLGFRKRRERGGELARLQLVLERLAVLEGQVGEHALDRQHVAIVSPGNRVARRLQRQRVGGKRARRAAEKLARELVERDDAREAIGAALQPFAPGAGSEFFVERKKALAHLGVEGRVLLEPALVPSAVFLACAEPEAQHA